MKGRVDRCKRKQRLLENDVLPAETVKHTALCRPYLLIVVFVPPLTKQSALGAESAKKRVLQASL